MVATSQCHGATLKTLGTQLSAVETPLKLCLDSLVRTAAVDLHDVAAAAAAHVCTASLSVGSAIATQLLDAVRTATPPLLLRLLRVLYVVVLAPRGKLALLAVDAAMLVSCAQAAVASNNDETLTLCLRVLFWLCEVPFCFVFFCFTYFAAQPAMVNPIGVSSERQAIDNCPVTQLADIGRLCVCFEAAAVRCLCGPVGCACLPSSAYGARTANRLRGNVTARSCCRCAQTCSIASKQGSSFGVGGGTIAAS